MNNSLLYGDNLPIMREKVATESVDLVYLDPPFKSNLNYNVLFKADGLKADEEQLRPLKTHGHGKLRLKPTLTNCRMRLMSLW